MLKKGCLAIIMMTLTGWSASALSQSVTESWLRQAGISCGGGLSYEVEGEISGALLKRFNFLDAEAQGSGKQQIAETEKLLKQFRDDEKRQAYVDYTNCVLQLMNIATEASGLPPREVVLDSPVAVADLNTIQRGQRFVMIPGDAVAIAGHELMFSINKIDTYREQPIVYFNWSNSETGVSESNKSRYQAQIVSFGENCTITPYKIEPEESQVSFLSNC